MKLAQLIRMAALSATLLTSAGTVAAAQQHGGQAGTLKVKFATASLDSLISHSTRVNYNQTQLDGFRIQIYSGSGVNSKSEAMASQARFMNMYPKTDVYVIYNAPFWRVRVGDFRSRGEALPMLNKMKGQFDGCYVVRDNTVRKKTFRQ